MAPFITKRNESTLDYMVIGQGHTIMANHIPKAVPSQEFSEKFFERLHPNLSSIQKYGLFGGDIDYNTYYPDLKPEDLKPSSEDFIEPMFRLLSATIVSRNWLPTDFSRGNVLKSSMSLLVGQTVNCDHETNIGNAIGSVSKTIWQEAYKDGGILIPAGINGILKIDGKANPRIARGILMDPPSIHSNSVTVQFKWDKSHPEMDNDDFFDKIGTYDEKGNMICRVVTEIVRYLETSLVSHGADVYAQKINSEGHIVNPVYANRASSAYTEHIEEDSSLHLYSFHDWKTVSNDKNNTPLCNTNSIKNVKNMDEALKAFLESLTGDGYLVLEENQELTKENVLTALKEVMENKASLEEQVNTLTSEKATLTEKITTLENQVTSLKEEAKIGTDYITQLRDDTIAQYKKLKGEAVDEVIVNMLTETKSVAQLKSFNKSYTEQLEEKFPMVCQECGSHDVSRASSKKEKFEEKTVVEDTSQLLDKLYTDKIQ